MYAERLAAFQVALDIYTQACKDLYQFQFNVQTLREIGGTPGEETLQAIERLREAVHEAKVKVLQLYNKELTIVQLMSEKEMTPEEADKAYDEAPAIPWKEGEVEALVKKITGK